MPSIPKKTYQDNLQQAIVEYDDVSRHSDDMQDIITAVPPWLLRWGISMYFIILVLIICLSALIKYPDIIKENLKIDSPNSPKPVVSKISGKLVKLLVTENTMVTPGQPLAYLESTADHGQVLLLLKNLITIHGQAIQNKPLKNLFLNQLKDVQYGELQVAYQAFYGEYLNYKSSVDNGFLVKKKMYLQKDLDFLTKQKNQLDVQKTMQQRDYKLAEDEYKMHAKLTEEKVETNSELRQEESKFLGKKSPLIQTEASLITNDNNFISKQKDILELENQLNEEQSKFLQALNSLISAVEDWKSKYILSASQSGKLSFSGIIQENQVVAPNQEIFYINPGNESFFGEMAISQENMGKVKEGQDVLIKLKSYPFEEYGILRGKIIYLAEVPYKDSVFMSKVKFDSKSVTYHNKPINLKQGMRADAEIITENATVIHRITSSLFKMVDAN
jgi:multidrug efflux pump subunit AcrA (membrane-fusion protein)